MQREEKLLENLLDSTLIRLDDLKNSIGGLLAKMEVEGESMNFPAFLDKFAVISGHLTALSKLLGNDTSPPLRNLTVLPLRLSMDHDPSLLQLTENRIHSFSHDIVPDYLRTKPEPAAETRMALHETKANGLLHDTATKQVAQYTKVVSHVHDVIQKAKDEWEIEASSRPGIHQTSSLADTHVLVSAVGMGKGLKMMGMGGMPGAPGMMIPPNQIRPAMGGPNPGVGPQIGKLPSALKTNIKSAPLHPYR